MFLQVQLTINALVTYQRKHNMSELMTVEALEPIQHDELHDIECYSDVITPVPIIPLILSPSAAQLHFKCFTMTIWSLSPESNNPVWYYATIKYLGKVISSNFWLRIEIWKKNHFKNYAHSKKVLEALQHITSLMILEKQRVPLKVYIEP